MHFEHSEASQHYARRLRTFLDEHVLPAEPRYEREREELMLTGQPHGVPAVVEELKDLARQRGLWNLFLPTSTDPAHGLSVLDYAPLAEITGWAPHLAPEALNCSPPDTGNSEVLHMFGTTEQKERWLAPLLAGTCRSAFAMTEPDVASSDARNIATTITREGDMLRVDGRKWWTTGALDPRCEFLIVMGVSDPDAPGHRRHSMVIIPTGTPGVTIHRSLRVFGYHDQPGHAEISFDGVRVPRSSLVGEPGGGFAVAQARLGPGRVHHCMRAIGMAERAIDLMCRRALERRAFGKPLSEQGVVRSWVAQSRVAVDQARLLVLQGAWKISNHGAAAARMEIAAMKVAVPSTVQTVIDRAIQVHGAAGVSDDLPLAWLAAQARTLRILDGPDEVHERDVARQELARHGSAPGAGHLQEQERSSDTAAPSNAPMPAAATLGAT